MKHFFPIQPFCVLPAIGKCINNNYKLPGQGDYDIKEIKERMHVLYPEMEPPEEVERRERYFKMKEIIRRVFESSEEGRFSKEQLALMIVESGLADFFLTIWNPKPGESTDMGTHVLVNRAVAYQVDNEDVISLHIKAPPFKNTSEILLELVDGFTKVAELLGNKFKDVKQITMESWLLGRSFDEKIKAFFGDNVVVEDVEDGQEGGQLMSLQYNRRALEEYLKTGKKPEVRKIVMTRGQFLERFGN